MRYAVRLLAGALALIVTAGPARAADEESSAASAPASLSSAEAPSPEEGGVFNIVTWNSALAETMKICVPSYREDEEGNASIGGLPIRWTVISDEGSGYEDWLDATLPLNGTLAADDRADLVLLNADSLRKYCRSDLTEPLDGERGIVPDAFEDSYAFAAEAAEDETGRLKAAALELEPGALIYRRDMAKRVLGSGEPETVQEAVKDFAALKKTAEKAAAAGVPLFQTAEQSFPVFSSARESGWVKDETAERPALEIPDTLKEWAETAALWRKAGALGESALFQTEEPDAAAGGRTDGNEAAFGMVKGPSVWLKGGVWIACAAGTDNPEADAELIRTLTLDPDTLMARASGSGDFVNARGVMETMAEGYRSTLCGGQNTRKLLTAQADALGSRKSAATVYDGMLDALFQEEMAPFIGGTADYAACERSFRKRAGAQFPELQS